MAENIIEFWNADCTQIVPASLPPFVFATDPPYSEFVHARMTSCAQHGDVKGVRHRDAGFGCITSELRAYLAEVARCSSRWSLVYSDDQGAFLWERAFKPLRKHKTGDGLIRVTPWIYDDGVWGDTEGGPIGQMPWIRWSSPQQSGDRPPQGWEVLVIGHGPGKLRWGGPGNLTHLRHKAERGEDKHTTAKPLDQALDLVAWFTEPGELVYDSTGGRGTFGVAAALLGRDYLGCEIDPEEWRKGDERIRNAREGILTDRDRNRFERWVTSFGGTPGDALVYRGATFRKGRPV